MKVYSDTSITKEDLSAVDNKQTVQIFYLRIAVAASFIFNVGLTLALRFL